MRGQLRGQLVGELLLKSIELSLLLLEEAESAHRRAGVYGRRRCGRHGDLRTAGVVTEGPRHADGGRRDRHGNDDDRRRVADAAVPGPTFETIESGGGRRLRQQGAYRMFELVHASSSPISGSLNTSASERRASDSVEATVPRVTPMTCAISISGRSAT